MSRPDPWYKRYARDFFDGTRALTLEERGAYSDIVDLLYMFDGSIPDDASWIGHQLHISSRKWMAIRTVLLAACKISCEGGVITNPRVSAEIENKLNQRRTNAENATKSQRKSNEKQKNANENNETNERNEPYARAFLDSDTEKKKEIEQPAPTEQAAAGGLENEVFGLNGSTAEIVGGIAKLLNTYSPDHDTAKRIVASNVGLFGAQAVRDGYAELMADLADNKVMVPRVKTLVAYFKQAGDKRAKAATPGGGPTRRLDYAEAKTERNKAFLDRLKNRKPAEASQ